MAWELPLEYHLTIETTYRENSKVFRPLASDGFWVTTFDLEIPQTAVSTYTAKMPPVM